MSPKCETLLMSQIVLSLGREETKEQLDNYFVAFRARMDWKSVINDWLSMIQLEFEISEF